ncbi:hypothetical protein SCOCK_500036 [Actinacidiphila cocklensis]|uniref:Uncharacterized protein n=1 Tax=Actinacidiphila cocklensis TaxID=887465 RepID=A0A9W4E196_9ACTN|nr:hypothetical protein SCOCK_500036 [Actinacidiphila cocklensis]
MLSALVHPVVRAARRQCRRAVPPVPAGRRRGVVRVPGGEPVELERLLAGAVARQRTEEPAVLAVQSVIDRRGRATASGAVLRGAHRRDIPLEGGPGGGVKGLHVCANDLAFLQDAVRPADSPPAGMSRRPPSAPGPPLRRPRRPGVHPP